jgi:heat shock protein HtpX
MKRRFSTRDRWLTAHMTVTLAYVLLLYATVPVVIALVIWIEPKHALYVALFAFAIVAAALYRFGRPGSDTPNAFAISIGGRANVICLTRGLTAALDDEEVDAVLAHELSHLANRDASVMTFASGRRTIGLTLLDTQGASLLWFFLWPLGLPFVLLGALSTLSLSRYREFAADRGSAVLTGRPASLMSALQKLDAAPIPECDLRDFGTVEAFCIVSTGHARLTLLRDHPPLAHRLARLEAMAREIGQAIGP